MHQAGENVGVLRQGEGHLSAGVLLAHLRVAHAGDAIVRHRSGHHDDIRVVGLAVRSRVHLGGGSGAIDSHVGTVGDLGQDCVFDVGGEQDDIGAPSRSGGGHSDTLASTGAVADVPDRIDRLTCAAGADEQLHSRQIVAGEARPRENL